MRAVVYDKFGSVDVLKIVDCHTPEPDSTELQIKIHASTVELEDPLMRKKAGLNGILKPKKSILGMEFAGVVTRIGKGVTLFSIGDRVFGNTGMQLGAHAEFIVLKETDAVVKIPDEVSFNEAASMTNGYLTAIPFLRDKGCIKPQQKILINGASGSVGAAAVQFCSYNGLTIHAVCSRKNKEKVQKWGVEKVICFDTEDLLLEIKNENYDIIFDIAGNLKISALKNNLKGVYLTTVPKIDVLFSMLISNHLSAKKAYMIASGLRKPELKKKDLQLLAEMVKKGAVVSDIDITYKLVEIKEAHLHIENKKKNGSVVIEVV